MATRVCIRKASLNKLGYRDLEHWLEDPNHIYIGRQNAWVKGAKHSKWHNPYSVKKYGLELCLKLYEQYLKDEGLDGCIEELRGKVLGCWCEEPPCHGQILVDLLDPVGSG